MPRFFRRCRKCAGLRRVNRATGGAQRAPVVGPAQPFCSAPSKVWNGTAQYCDHRPRRPRQDDPGGRPPEAGRRLPRQPAGGDAGHGFQRSGARARHHHPRQVHVDRVEGHAHQHRRYAGPRRLRRRGGAHPQHGGWRHRAVRRLRRAPAPDQVRGVEGVEARAAADRGGQQDRPAGRAPRRGVERNLRSVRRAGCHRRAARFPDPVRLGPRRLDGDGSRRAAYGPSAALRSHRQPRAAADSDGRSVPPAGNDAGG